VKGLGLVGLSVLAALGCSGTTEQPPPAVAVTAVGDVQGSPAQATVPASGGTLSSADGRLKIDVPSGALAADQMLTIQPISNKAPGGLGAAYRLGPDGLTFSTPVKITFTYGAAELAGNDATSFRIAYQDAQGSWDAPTSFTQDQTAQTVAIDVSHFTDYSFLTGFQLRPAEATVMGGATVSLAIAVCVASHNGSLPDQLSVCEPGADYFADVEWAVNGKVGGDSSNGTIMSTGEGQATYTAPAVAPPANPVAVSASATSKKGQKTALVANVWVDARPPLSGTISTTQRDPVSGLIITTTASVDWIWDTSTGGTYVTKSGQVDATYDISDAMCATHATATAMIGPKEGGIIIVGDGTYFAQGDTEVTYTGNTFCNGGHSEAFTLSESEAWWPAWPGFFMVKPDDTFEESLTEGPVGELLVTEQWSFMPSP
jgi:hypothetical protein